MVFVNFEVGKIRALVYTLFSSYKLNLGKSSVKPKFASKKESIFPISVQYPHMGNSLFYVLQWLVV